MNTQNNPEHFDVTIIFGTGFAAAYVLDALKTMRKQDVAAVVVRRSMRDH